MKKILLFSEIRVDYSSTTLFGKKNKTKLELSTCSSFDFMQIFFVISAIVEFDEAAEARKAFKSLAYSKFKNMPLYLEWAPEDSLKEKNTQIQNKDDNSEKQSISNEAKKNEVIEDDDEEPEPDTTLFVKNLNFKTTDEDLKKVNMIN